MQPADSLWHKRSLRHRGTRKDFARRFAAERAFLLASVNGSLAPDERERWVSSLIGRQMFLRFLQEHLHSSVSSHGPVPSCPLLQVPEGAVQRLVTFFDRYEWEWDELSPRAEHALTPEILGHTFEK